MIITIHWGEICMLFNMVFKKSVMPALLTVAIILSMFSTSSRAHAQSGPNLALNPSGTGFPEVTASYTCGCDSVWSVVNGTFYYKDDEPRDRWTDYGGSATDSLDIDFGSAKSFNQVKLYIFNDGGGVQPPASYSIQFWNGMDWVDTTNQTKTPTTPTATVNTLATPENTLNTVDFDTVTSQKLRVLFTNNGSYSGLVELEVFLQLTADESAASEMMTEIEQLPIQASVALSDKSAVAAARSFYDNLTASQKSLVTNLSKLTAAEAAIAALEAALIPGVKDITVLSAFSNISGNTITLKLSSVLDITYRMHYDSADSSNRTIKLLLSTPALLNSTNVTLSLQSGALKTSNNELNTAIHSIPVITSKNLDLSLDHLIGVEDVVLMIGNPASQIDVNQDGIFNREDIFIILGQISTH
jgi:hypothetical protein